MARRIAAVSILTAASAVGLAVACVDLFHSTDFKTLCTEKPDDPQCGGSGTPDGGSDAGTDAPAKPPIDLCSLTSPQVKERAIKACALLGACGGSIEPDAFSQCVPRAMFAMDCAANPYLRPLGDNLRLWQCLAEAATCKDIDTCVFRGSRQDCKSAPFTSCSDPSVSGGTVRIDCASPASADNTRFEPCLAFSQRCTRVGDSDGYCTGGLGNACSVTGCSGTNAAVCDGITDNGIDCAGLGGGTCYFDIAAGGPACTPGPGARSCPVDGGALTAIVNCDESNGVALACVDGKEVAIDCRRLGLACDPAVNALPHDPFAKCVTDALVAQRCNETVDTCDGDNLRGCSKGGERYIASCTSLGLGKCAETDAGAVRANCTKP